MHSPRQKTKQAASKRFIISATGKLQHRAVKQSHFNAKASGNATRRKHIDQNVDHSDQARIRDLLPFA